MEWYCAEKSFFLLKWENILYVLIIFGLYLDILWIAKILTGQKNYDVRKIAKKNQKTGINKF